MFVSTTSTGLRELGMLINRPLTPPHPANHSSEQVLSAWTPPEGLPLPPELSVGTPAIGWVKMSTWDLLSLTVTPALNVLKWPRPGRCPCWRLQGRCPGPVRRQLWTLSPRRLGEGVSSRDCPDLWQHPNCDGGGWVEGSPWQLGCPGSVHGMTCDHSDFSLTQP